MIEQFGILNTRKMKGMLDMKERSLLSIVVRLPRVDFGLAALLVDKDVKEPD